MGHIPIRTCVACRRAEPQRTLVRVAVVDGDVVVDRGRRRMGRGAYVCPRPSCIDAALRRDGAALRRTLARHGRRIRIDEQRLVAECTTAAESAARQETASAVGVRRRVPSGVIE